ncbi:hypothetical protein [Marinobacterium lutimaris]|uniref:Uncharacterized protein n=1 Tax=Marinobacterium lutimaris TaxID=568106 RepID=A0A1H6AWA6_9GAMM|nr:hypothetical protein [Marinobacterium lutimaris]SEG52889.1 hypothetical protein SAMN05444390_102258 [Marinobacterium lutimaris]
MSDLVALYELVPAKEWLKNHRLSPKEIDCVIALKLKILDGKCKMNKQDKTLAAELYRECHTLKGDQLGDEMHALIARAGETPSQEMIEQIYETRVLAETRISRPVMKAFKARLRDTGLLPAKE